MRKTIKMFGRKNEKMKKIKEMVKMKRGYKILLFFILTVVLTLLIPFLANKLIPADRGMAVCMIMFFAIYPICSIILGVVISNDMKYLWWMPLVSAFVFPLLFSIAMSGMVWELYTYSGIYIFLGYAVAAFIFIIRKIKLERQE